MFRLDQLDLALAALTTFSRISAWAPCWGRTKAPGSRSAPLALKLLDDILREAPDGGLLDQTLEQHSALTPMDLSMDMCFLAWHPGARTAPGLGCVHA